MKKFFSILILIGLLIVLTVPQIVSVALAQAGTPDKCTISARNLARLTAAGITGCTADCPFTTAVCGTCCLLSAIYNVTDWIFVGLVVLSVIMVLFGAYYILTAGGVPAKIELGRSYILYAAIGLLAAFLARAVPAIVELIGGF